MNASLNGSKMTCKEFHAIMPDLIGSGDNIHLHPHVQTCELCRALISDLETIRDAARELFPAVEPPDTLWSQIESAISKEEGAEEQGKEKEEKSTP